MPDAVAERRLSTACGRALGPAYTTPSRSASRTSTPSSGAGPSALLRSIGLVGRGDVLAVGRVRVCLVSVRLDSVRLPSVRLAGVCLAGVRLHSVRLPSFGLAGVRLHGVGPA